MPHVVMHNVSGYPLHYLCVIPCPNFFFGQRVGDFCLANLRAPWSGQKILFIFVVSMTT